MKIDDLVLLVAESNKEIFEIEQALATIGAELRIRVARRLEEVCCYFSGIGIYDNRASHPLPALVLVDLSSPDGRQIVEWIRKHAPTPHTTIVGFGTATAEEQIQKAIDTGLNAYYSKDHGFLDLADLLQTLDLSTATATDSVQSRLIVALDAKQKPGANKRI